MEQITLLSPADIQRLVSLEVQRQLAEQQPLPQKNHLLIDEASQLSGMARKTLYNLVSLGEIPPEAFFKSGRRIVFYRESFLQWFENRNAVVINFQKKKNP